MDDNIHKECTLEENPDILRHHNPSVFALLKFSDKLIAFIFSFMLSLLDSLPCINLAYQTTICIVSSYEWNLLQLQSCPAFAFVATFRPQ